MTGKGQEGLSLCSLFETRREAMANQDISMIAHLMRRAGFGAPREELEVRTAKGYEATVEELLHPEEQRRA